MSLSLALSSACVYTSGSLGVCFSATSQYPALLLLLLIHLRVASTAFSTIRTAVNLTIHNSTVIHSQRGLHDGMCVVICLRWHMCGACL